MAGDSGGAIARLDRRRAGRESMRSLLFVASVALLTGAAPPKKLLTPNDIVTPHRRMPGGRFRQTTCSSWTWDWRPRGAPARAAFAPVHVTNIKALARPTIGTERRLSRPGQLCRAMGPQRERQALAGGSHPKPPDEYMRPLKGLSVKPLGFPTLMRRAPALPTAGRSPTAKDGWANLSHCYATVGVGRDMSPDTGTGGELYAVIGHATRHLDRISPSSAGSSRASTG